MENSDSQEFRTLFPSHGSRPGADETLSDLAPGSEEKPEQPFGETVIGHEVEDASGLKKKLIELQLITEAEWQAAAGAAGSDDPRRVLFELTRVPSGWSQGMSTQFPALTEFQANQILAGHGERLRLQHYVILDRLGAGGMGEVFKARNLSLPRLEAIKTIRCEESLESTEARANELERFQREARVLAQLDHPYITTVHHAGRDHGVNFIAMEYVSGETLKQIVDDSVERGELVPVWWAVERVMAVAQALQHAHERGVIHRDIKPHNIMITDNNDLKVLDMGIARLAHGKGVGGTTTSLTRDAMSLGTPDVMSPEQWANAKAVTPESDIYSLGCTFYYLLTGKMPFVADNINGLMFAHVNDPPPRASNMRPDVPAGLDEVIARMMAKKPQDRYRSAEELIAALEPFASASEEEKPPPPTPPSWVKAAIGLVLLIVLGVGGYFGFQALIGPGKVQPPKGGGPEDVAALYSGWLSKHLEQYGDVWGDKAGFDAFLAKSGLKEPQSPEELSSLEEKAEAAAQKRRTLIADAESRIRDFYNGHKEDWESLDRVKAFAYDKTPKNTIADADAVEGILDTLSKETERRATVRFAARVKESLQKFRAENDDIWSNDDAFDAFVTNPNRAVQRSDVKSEEGLRTLLQELQAETWRRRADDWVAENHGHWMRAWPSESQLRNEIQDKFPDGVADAATFEQMKAFVRGKAQALTVAAARQWLSDYGKEHREVWPSAEELMEAANGLVTPDELVDDKAFDQMADRIERMTEAMRRPFQSVKLPPIADAVEKYQAESFLYMCQWLLGLQAKEQDKSAGLEIETRIDDRNVRVVTPGQQYTIYARAKKKGYLTLFAFGTNKGQFILRFSEPIEPGTWVRLIPVPVEGPAGTDRFLFYLTDADAMAKAPKVPKAVAERLNAGQLKDLRGIIPQREAQIERLEKAFGYPAIYHRIVRCLREGVACPLVPANPDVQWWSRTVVEMTVKNGN